MLFYRTHIQQILHLQASLGIYGSIVFQSTHQIPRNLKEKSPRPFRVAGAESISAQFPGIWQILVPGGTHFYQNRRFLRISVPVGLCSTWFGISSKEFADLVLFRTFAIGIVTGISLKGWQPFWAQKLDSSPIQKSRPRRLLFFILTCRFCGNRVLDVFSFRFLESHNKSDMLVSHDNNTRERFLILIVLFFGARGFFYGLR